MPSRRASRLRLAAPVAFLAGVTVAVLLVRAGLHHEQATTAGPPPPAATTVHRPAKTTAKAPAAAQYYTVQSGDTFGTIASRFGTTVAALEQLNPGVSSNALRIGQKIRVK